MADRFNCRSAPPPSPRSAPRELQEGKRTSVWCICSGMMYFHKVKWASEWKGKPLLSDFVDQRRATTSGRQLLFPVTYLWTLKWFLRGQMMTIQCGSHVCVRWHTHTIRHKTPHREGVHVQCVCTAVNSYSVCFTSTRWSRGIDYRRGNSFIPICWRASSNISLLPGKFLSGSRHCAKCYGPLNVVFQWHTLKWGLWELSKENFNVLWSFLWRLVDGLEADTRQGADERVIYWTRWTIAWWRWRRLVVVQVVCSGKSRERWRLGGIWLRSSFVTHTDEVQKKQQS